MEVQRQLGFGAGVWEGADQLEQAPDGTVTQADNMFVDPLGVLRTRNGIPDLQANGWGGGRLSWVFEGNLTPGVRAIAASRSIPGTPGTYDASHGLAALDGSQNLATMHVDNSVVGTFSGFYYLDYPLSWTVLDSMLFIGMPGPPTVGGDNADFNKQGLVYGGSLKTAVYRPGTNATLTQGSAVVTLPAGGFAANVDAGMLMRVATVGGTMRLYVVKSVDSNTQITLVQPFEGSTTTTGVPTFSPLAMVGGFSKIQNDFYRASNLYGACAGRLLSLEGNKLYVSLGPNPATGASRAYSFPVSNIIEFPLDAQGIAVQTIRNQVFVFTTAGVYRVTGLEYDIVDPDGNPQWTIELLSRELVALSNAAIVSWHQALIVPCRDAIYVIDGVNPPQSITLGVDWQRVANDARALGQAAVHQGYYLLPVETSAGSMHFTTYCFRLQPVETARGIVFPNTRFLCDVEGWFSSGPKRLLAAGSTLWEGGGLFDPLANPAEDGDGSTLGTTFTSRPFVLGGGAVLRRIRARLARPGGIPFVSAVSSAVVPVGTSAPGDAVGATNGETWIAYDLVAPMGDTEPKVRVVMFTQRIALLGVEVQYRAAGLPAG